MVTMITVIIGIRPKPVNEYSDSRAFGLWRMKILSLPSARLTG